MAQCKAITKKEERCKKNAGEGSDYCYLHESSLKKKFLFFLSAITGIRVKYIFPAVIISTVIFLLGVYVEHECNLIISEYEKKFDIDIIIFSEAQDNDFPITVHNCGDKKLSNIKVDIKSCDMDYPKPYYITELLPTQRQTIHFQDEKTWEEYKKQDCTNGNVNLTGYTSCIHIYKDLRTGKLYSPPTNETLDVCGYCYWDIAITTSEGFNKTFREAVYSTIQLSFSTTGDNLNFSRPYFEHLGTFCTQLFDKRMLELQYV